MQEAKQEKIHYVILYEILTFLFLDMLQSKQEKRWI